MGGTCSHMGEWRGAFWVLVGKPKGKNLLGKPKCRWEDNIKMEFRKWDGELGLD